MPDTSEQKTGTFRPISQDEAIARLRESEERGKNPSLYGQEPDFFTKGLDLAVQTFGKPQVVYYPGSGTHVGPSFTPGLSESRIIYFDQDEHSIKKLKEAGYESYQGDVQYFVPGDRVDLLIMLNFNHPKPPEFVRPGGIVVCNDWWNAATDLKNNPDFELVGAILEDPETRNVSIETQNLADFLTPVETEEEWNEREGFMLGLYREQVDSLNSSLPQDQQVDTTSLISAVKELKEKLGENCLVFKIPYKKGAVLRIFKKKD